MEITHKKTFGDHPLDSNRGFVMAVLLNNTWENGSIRYEPYNNRPGLNLHSLSESEMTALANDFEMLAASIRQVIHEVKLERDKAAPLEIDADALRNDD